MQEEGQGQIPTQNPNVGFPGPQEQTVNAPKKNWKWLIVLILFLIVIAGVTFFVFKSSRSSSTLEESPTPESSLTNLATPESTATPMSSPTADKTQIKIQILNGTGIAGEAGLLSSALKDLGYTNTSTGNATNQNTTDTQVSFSSTLGQDVVTEITSKLKDLYTNVVTDTKSMSDFDVIVTTGLRKGQTSAPSATDAPTTSTASPSATPAQ